MFSIKRIFASFMQPTNYKESYYESFPFFTIYLRKMKKEMAARKKNGHF